jgi:hypothetical protein
MHRTLLTIRIQAIDGVGTYTPQDSQPCRLLQCKGCASHNLQSFSGELAIHFPGWDGLTKPLVFVFPKLEVCLDCGSTNFSIPKEQLNFLRGNLALGAWAGDALRR